MILRRPLFDKSLKRLQRLHRCIQTAAAGQIPLICPLSSAPSGRFAQIRKNQRARRPESCLRSAGTDGCSPASLLPVCLSTLSTSQTAHQTRSRSGITIRFRPAQVFRIGSLPICILGIQRFCFRLSADIRRASPTVAPSAHPAFRVHNPASPSNPTPFAANHPG